jgi:hypothetical protein
VAYGGVDAVGRVHTLRQDGMLMARSGAGHGEVTRISSGTGTLSVLVAYPARAEIRIVEKGRGWRGAGVESMAEVDGPLLSAMVAQAARLRLPRLLLDSPSVVRLESDAGDRDVLEVTLAADLKLRLFVDGETRYITRSESILTDVPVPFGFATDYSDFRRVDGVVFPFREETFAAGVHTSSMLLGSVEINPRGDRARLPSQD